MTRKRYVHRFQGTCLGQEIAVLVCKHQSTWDNTPPTIVQWGNDRIVLDRSLPMNLSRLVPSGYCTPTVKASDWDNFMIAAIAMGKI
jgi:hypothetical protein